MLSRKTPTPEIPPSPRADSPSHSRSDELSTALSASLPPSGHSRTTTQDESAYSHSQTDVSFESASSAADRSMTTTTRAYKTELVPANRPTTLLMRQPSFRVVSLPEATPKFRMKTVLEKKTARVVSMPVPRRDPASDGLDAQSIVGDPFGSEDEERTRVRVRSQATDVPHTPSIPSSPDSVVIIANTSNQLSTEFLKPRVDEESASESDTEGWITWTQSPPRPIPALHGPLSLPYARCPSGAEGTIIEEPDSLPRVIWGLNGEATSNKSQVKSVHPPPASVKPAAEITGETARPAVKIQHASKPSIAQDIQASSAAPTDRARQDNHNTTSSYPTHAELPRPPEFILKHSEPIDLGRLMGHSLERNYVEVVPDGALPSPRWQTSYASDLRTPELVHDISPELQAALFAQDRFRSYGLTTPSWSSSSDIHGLSNTSLPASSSSGSLLESLKSSRSPILLEELASQHLPHSQGLASRTSALDIAQSYRQQQLQGILPTPPETTSPIWSSTFSPYQSGMLSPELLAAAALSQMNSTYLSSQAIPSRLESSQHLLRAVPNALGSTGLSARNAALGPLSPAAHITGIHGQKIPPRLAAEYARRCTLPDPYPTNAQLHDYVLPYSSPVRGSNYSPTMPKAPPNTPYGSAPPYGLRRVDAAPITQPSFSAAPSSPSSSRELQNTGLPQHIRSVPLSRLVQRRLSTVPEEDYASSVDAGRMPPAPGRASAQGTAGNGSGLHLFLSSTGRASVNAAPSDMLGDHVRARYDVRDMGVSADKTRTITPGVKLPGVPRKGHGPVVSREAQVAKEASGRQGSNNTNIDGGRRGEGVRGRGHRRGGRGRKGRGGHANGVHGAERVDGGLVVKS
ncbi:hypothetical protein BD309DRAFT_909797 [Dichomitus squalens]|nr:hypothetical protein BD309DRAFT_909797 [Dichomitus squalens]